MDDKESALSSRVLHVISKGEVGGAQTSLLNYVEALSKTFEQIVFIGGKHRFLGVCLDEMQIKNYQIDFNSIAGIIQFSSKLRLHKGRNDPVVIIHSFIASAITRILLTGSCIKIIYVVHGFVGNPSVSFLKRSIGLIVEKSLKRGVHKYIAITNYEKTLIQRFLKREATVIPNTTNIRRADRVRKRKLHQIICLSRFAKPKRNLLIAKSFLTSRLLNHPNYILSFFGVGPDLEKCKLLTENKATNIEYHQPVNDVKTILETAGSLILMSDHEGLPMTILEALASDIPIICSSIVELKQIFQSEGQANILFCNNNETDLTEVFNRYGNWIKSLEIGKNEKYFEDNFSCNHVRKLIQDAIEN